jgi:hypothetical protein
MAMNITISASQSSSVRFADGFFAAGGLSVSVAGGSIDMAPILRSSGGVEPSQSVRGDPIPGR